MRVAYTMTSESTASAQVLSQVPTHHTSTPGSVSEAVNVAPTTSMHTITRTLARAMTIAESTPAKAILPKM